MPWRPRASFTVRSASVSWPFPDTVRLLPCHYPGGRRDGPLAPTLAEVRAAVPELRLEESEFADRVTAAMPPRPANHERIIAVNLGRGGTAWTRRGSRSAPTTAPSAPPPDRSGRPQAPVRNLRWF